RDADDLVVRADVGVADAALVALAADDVRLRRDEVAGPHAEVARRLRADRHHLAEELVADDALLAALAIERLVDHVLHRAAEPDAAVGAAEAGEARPDERHAGVAVVLRLVERRRGHLLAPQAARRFPDVARAVIDQCVHGFVHRGEGYNA